MDKFIVDGPIDGATHQRICNELYAGRKLAAVKCYRATTQSTLAAAKGAVDKIEADQRLASPEQFIKPQVPTALGCFQLLATVAMAVTAAIYAQQRLMPGSTQSTLAAHRAMLIALLCMNGSNALVLNNNPKRKKYARAAFLATLLWAALIYASFHSS
jgi:hypothetical protein